ncbi:MAG TPA: acyl-CoA ligase (AMP-forming), exosortase A system-associated [Casimicrobiaceae bacterium]|nr:acyl-CoA ligase (AMP-forming), exosortase A system-associated [Casimicrobiaceae bacterium]
MTDLLHQLPLARAADAGSSPALTLKERTLSYAELGELIDRFATGLLNLGVARGERVAFYLDKRFETVAAAFGTTKAGGVFVPVNPLLKGDQVAHILRDCSVRVLVTTEERLRMIASILAACDDLRHVVVIGESQPPAMTGKRHVSWSTFTADGGGEGHRVIDTDMAAILYTSGSTGKPKGVVLSHRNMVAGARSVASYLENGPADTILSALPLSFDAGFSQLTTAFESGARVVLLNYLLPRDVLQEMVREKVTGLTAVPPLWIQLVQLDWPGAIAQHLRYIANTGGRMPRETLAQLRQRLPNTKPFLMYGLTEAFRSTYLPPSEVDRRPDSIGKAIPNAEILVLRPDGTACGPNEPGELVHRGALVGMGYWNDAEKTAERYKPLPIGVGGREGGLMLPEMAVFSGDTVQKDEDGFLYFIGRRDEMIKTSGYRVSPTELEEAVYAMRLVGEVAAFGVAHPSLGQAIVLSVTPAADAPLDSDRLLAECRRLLPAYMVPQDIDVHHTSLPRNPNGKIDRKTLASQYEERRATQQ